MNITFFSVAHLSFGGGYEQQIIRLVNALAERGHNIRVVTLSKKATHRLAVFLSFLYFHPRFSFPELQKNRKIFTQNKNIQYISCDSITSIKESLLNTDVIYAKNEILDSLILRFAIDSTTPPRIVGMHTVLAYSIADSIHSKLHNIFYQRFFL